MRKLKQFIFDYLRKKMPERHPRFPHLDQPLKVMIVYESDLLERNDAIKSIRQDLLRRQMDVTMWGYVEKKEINTLILPQSRILGVGDYNFFDKPRDYVLDDLQTEQYDLLIDLTTRPCLPLRYITDMLISLPDLTPEQGEEAALEASWLYDQIMSFITTIKSND